MKPSNNTLFDINIATSTEIPFNLLEHGIMVTFTPSILGPSFADDLRNFLKNKEIKTFIWYHVAELTTRTDPTSYHIIFFGSISLAIAGRRRLHAKIRLSRLWTKKKSDASVRKITRNVAFAAAPAFIEIFLRRKGAFLEAKGESDASDREDDVQVMKTLSTSRARSRSPFTDAPDDPQIIPSVPRDQNPPNRAPFKPTSSMTGIDSREIPRITITRSSVTPTSSSETTVENLQRELMIQTKELEQCKADRAKDAKEMEARLQAVAKKAEKDHATYSNALDYGGKVFSLLTGFSQRDACRSLFDPNHQRVLFDQIPIDSKLPLEHNEIFHRIFGLALSESRKREREEDDESPADQTRIQVWSELTSRRRRRRGFE